MAGIQALGILMTPTPEKASFEEILQNQLPGTEPFAYRPGTNRFAPELIWYGDFDTEKIRNGDLVETILLQGGIGALEGYLLGGGHFGGPVPDPPSAYIGLMEGGAAGMILGGMSSLRTYSWKYFAGWVYDLGWGPIDAMTELYKDERRVYTGSNNAGSTITVNDPNAWGGEHVNGGEYYVADIMPGALYPFQQPNPYLRSLLGHVPAWSGKARLVIHGGSTVTGEDDKSGYFAAGVQGGVALRPVSCTTLHLPNLLGVPEYKAINDGKDANIIEVMYDWMTARARGYGYGGRVSTDSFHMDSWRAAAQKVWEENLGHSAEYKDSGVSARDTLEEMAAFGSAAVFENPRTGEIKINLIRRNYSIPSLRVFDETKISSVKGFSQETRQSAQTPNEIRLTFNDRDNNYKARPLNAQNDAAIRAAGGAIIPRNVAYRGVACQPTAKLVLARELRAAFPRPPFTIVVPGLEADEVEYGEVVIWSYPKYRVEQRVARVIGIEKSNTEVDAVELTCAEDVFGTGDALNVVIGETTWTLPRFQFNEVELRLPKIQLALQGFVGAVNGVLNITLPTIALDLGAAVETAGELNITLPTIDLSLSATTEGAILTEEGEVVITEGGETISEE